LGSECVKGTGQFLSFFSLLIFVKMSTSKMVLAPGGVSYALKLTQASSVGATGDSGDSIGESTRRLLTTVSGGSKAKPASSLLATKPTPSTFVSQGGGTAAPVTVPKPVYTPFASVGRKHGVRVENIPSISIESYVTEMARVVGAGSIVAASRANGGVIFFFSNMESVDRITAEGLSIDNNYLNVSSLDRTPVKIVLSNLPPYIPNGDILDKLSEFGSCAGPMKTIPLGIKIPALRHVQSFRREVSLLVKSPLPDSFVIEYAGKHHRVFINTNVVCYLCKERGHIRKRCPRNKDKPVSSGTVNVEKVSVDEDNVKSPEQQSVVPGGSAGEPTEDSLCEEARNVEATVHPISEQQAVVPGASTGDSTKDSLSEEDRTVSATLTTDAITEKPVSLVGSEASPQNGKRPASDVISKSDPKNKKPSESVSKVPPQTDSDNSTSVWDNPPSSSQASSIDDETMSNCSGVSDLSVDMDDEPIANEKDALTFCEFVEGVKHSKHLVDDLMKFQPGLTKTKLVNMLVRTRKRSGITAQFRLRLGKYISKVRVTK
jgi:hypothetical protein